ncbi:MAG TPA: 50S ribosomal protein L27 [Candidatus Saccharimonadales bacterium]
MSKIKAGGSSKNVHDSPGQRLGVKAFGGEKVTTGSVIVRQVGQTKVPGPGTGMGRDYTIFAKRDGVVEYKKTKITRFTGKTAPRTLVSVVEAQPVKATSKKK